jgi:hypothetical protein
VKLNIRINNCKEYGGVFHKKENIRKETRRKMGGTKIPSFKKMESVKNYEFTLKRYYR